MDFKWATDRLKEGKSVRREAWEDGACIYVGNLLEVVGKYKLCPTSFGAWINAMDWQLYQEPKPKGHDFEWATGKMLQGRTVVERDSGLIILLRSGEGISNFVCPMNDYAIAILRAEQILSQEWALVEDE